MESYLIQIFHETYQENILQLIHVVDTLGEKLTLDLVNNLVHAVSPIGHSLLLFFSHLLSKDCLFLILILDDQNLTINSD